MRTVIADALDILRQGARTLSAQRWRVLAFVIVLLAVTLLMVPYDAEWLARLTSPQSPDLLALARWLTHWGDYHTGSFLLAAALLALGLGLGRERLRRAALASILAASVAGLTANVFRGLIGRPRPVAELPDGLYGPTMRFELQGSPSAHAATSVGSAAALLVAVPPVGVAAAVAAGGVVWSRLYLRHHHPTDVVVGGSLGAMFGAVLGLAARRGARSKRDPAEPAGEVA